LAHRERLGYRQGPHQEKSFFCLENDHLQLFGLDTGKMSSNFPLQVRQDLSTLTPEEEAWFRQKVFESNKSMILFTHHQYFSAYWNFLCPEKNNYFDDLLKKTGRKYSAWMWGHEHRLSVYEDHDPVYNPHCIGHGAYPEDSYDNFSQPSHRIIPGYVPRQSPNGIHANGFIILNLKGGLPIHTQYFQVFRHDGTVQEQPSRSILLR